ncbi:winged helix-turn-helix domain-containing protein [Mucilaginibacter gotjawali]|uniref:Molybdate transport system regulatory protein n=1 Tax=Mucilaginibacter gotjawali TaxID=1550579 RepID=A0A839SAU7_9SPHI|nr:winged helix-turn-helix domain-containing protein [Mucilaginibacter gotjawali]MBB3054482.1 molybdate transport system regulatory protein [Mucilaginibacter gotjawali]
MNKKIKTILKEDARVKVSGSLWLESDGKHFFGPGPVELLERIAETGSISEAAKQMQMSYKKAWELVNALNSQTQNPVVIPRTGGEKGGGSTITEEAKVLIEYHRELRKRFAAFLEDETQRLKG